MNARVLLKEEAKKILANRRIQRAHESTTGAVIWRDPLVKPVAWQLELGEVCDQFIQAVHNREGPRLNLSAPPRHGKTEYVGRAMPIHAMLSSNRPITFYYVTASDERAEEVSRRVKSAVERIYEQTGDFRFQPGEKWSTTDWETAYGFAWKATGWSANTGGIGAQILIMDDLTGTSETYRSPSKRERIKHVIKEDLMPRVMDGGGVIHMETRRGTLDTTQWLLDNYGSVWKSVVWKCYDEERGYLWPENYGDAWRRTMPHLSDNSTIWRSLYQQEPVEEGGVLIPMDWLTNTYLETPLVARSLAERVVIGVDLAATGKTKSDPACFVVVAVRGAYRDILHVVNRQCDYVEQKQILKDLCTTWKPNAVVVERAAGGDAMIAELQREIRGLRGESAVGDKVIRLNPHLGRFAAGQVRTPKAQEQWVGPWREELSAFTGTAGRMDNQVDATVWALVASDTKPKIDAARAAADIRRFL